MWPKKPPGIAKPLLWGGWRGLPVFHSVSFIAFPIAIGIIIHHSSPTIYIQTKLYIDGPSVIVTPPGISNLLSGMETPSSNFVASIL